MNNRRDGGDSYNPNDRATMLYSYTCPTPQNPADAQVAAIRTHCSRMGLTLDGEFGDIASGAWAAPIRDRPGGKALIATLAPGDEVLIAGPPSVASSLGGYVAAVTAMGELGMRITLAGNPAGPKPTGGLRRAERVLSSTVEPASLSELPKAEQIAIGMAYTKQAGKRTTRFPPPGYRWRRRKGGCYLVPDEEEQKLIRLIVRWRDQDGRSWLEIARWLLMHRVKVAATKSDWSVWRIRRAYKLATGGNAATENQAEAEPKASGPAAAKEA